MDVTVLFFSLLTLALLILPTNRWKTRIIQKFLPAAGTFIYPRRDPFLQPEQTLAFSGGGEALNGGGNGNGNALNGNGNGKAANGGGNDNGKAINGGGKAVNGGGKATNGGAGEEYSYAAGTGDQPLDEAEIDSNGSTERSELSY